MKATCAVLACLAPLKLLDRSPSETRCFYFQTGQKCAWRAE